MRVVYYVSGHGLGHASRSIEVIRAVRSLEPAAVVIVRTSAPRWLFDSAIPGMVEYQRLEADTGVVQRDSLTLDEEATARAAEAFDRRFDPSVEHEARVLHDLEADVVAADVPPLAVAAAHRASLPSIVIANFTWDWIFGAYSVFDRLAPNAIPTIRDAYARTTMALRLPLHGGFDAMPVVHDIPLIARRSSRDPIETRRRLGIEAGRTVVLSSFGGHGIDLPIAELQQAKDFVLLAPEREPPPGFKYEDLVAAADVVVSKPGYGIISECAANDTALVYTSRGHFIEYDVLVEGMPQLLRSRFIAPEDLRTGRWAAAIRGVLGQARPPERPRLDGASVAARCILHALD
jgi:L-arabinokinase